MIVKIILGLAFYDLIVKPIVKSILIVTIRHSKKARAYYDKMVLFVDMDSTYRIDAGSEFERRQRISVGDLMLVVSGEFGKELVKCTELDKKIMLSKRNVQYYKVFKNEEKRRRT